MKNIAFHNIYESLKKNTDVEMLEHEIYICETSEISTEGYFYPLKTDCTIFCICLKGELRGKIDLKEYQLKAPGLGVSFPGQILEHESASDDFQGIIIYMTQRFMENFNIHSGYSMSLILRNQPTIVLNEEELGSVMEFCNAVRKALRTDNPNRLYMILHLTIAYFYGLEYYLTNSISNRERSREQILTDNFLQKVRQYHKQERRVEYYAGELNLSPNYLSHVIKDVTGKTAGKWIDDYVALEAKALLKSTNMTIQQIADELSFPSQSFFGKFFKRVVGIAPKHYR